MEGLALKRLEKCIIYAEKSTWEPRPRAAKLDVLQHFWVSSLRHKRGVSRPMYIYVPLYLDQGLVSHDPHLFPRVPALWSSKAIPKIVFSHNCLLTSRRAEVKAKFQQCVEVLILTSIHLIHLWSAQIPNPNPLQKLLGEGCYHPSCQKHVLILYSHKPGLLCLRDTGRFRRPWQKAQTPPQ